MEPIVLLDDIKIEEPKTFAKRKKRRFQRKKGFTRSKLWYKTMVGIPKKPRANFRGFEEGANKNVKGFTEFEILSSLEEHSKSTLYGAEHFESKAKVTSIGLIENGNFEHKLVICPILKRSLRALSLFDGISTGLYILESKLNLKVEAYFSSEIEESALKLQSDRWGGQIFQLGNVKNLSEEVLSALGRIDLLIGGSPCDELSLVNWRGRGIHDPESSGHLFFDFVTIRDYLRKRMADAGLPFFCLFENTSHMKKTTLADMTCALGCEPTTFCASSFVPMVRKRNFWSNIPGMQDICLDKEQTSTLELQQFLRPNRTANFTCAKTITSNKTNQIAENRLPVEMNGKEEFLNVNEIESLMGFPLHYTDGCNLSIKQRCDLLSKGWCVPVVETILQPLSEIYLQKVTKEVSEKLSADTQSEQCH